MIQLQQISKYYNSKKAVDDISFEVKEGETVVLLGTSGCGKTTTLRMINRLTEPTAGQIFINGKNALEQPAEKLRRSIGYVLQHHGLFPHYTVAENIAVVPKLLKWDESKIEKRIDELLEKFQLSSAQYRSLYPDELSGGQQQRVGLARALAANPSLLLMDEPFGALDTITRTNIRKEFSELDELKRKTIVMVTHDVQEAFELGDKICLMDKGKIVQIGTPSQLLFSPINEFVRAFLHQQHFQLELQSITINDVWTYLNNGSMTATKNIPTNHSLWQALEVVSAGNKAFAVRDGQQKDINITSLMAAFSQYKTALTNG